MSNELHNLSTNVYSSLYGTSHIHSDCTDITLWQLNATSITAPAKQYVWLIILNTQSTHSFTIPVYSYHTSMMTIIIIYTRCYQ